MSQKSNRSTSSFGSPSESSFAGSPVSPAQKSAKSSGSSNSFASSGRSPMTPSSGLSFASSGSELDSAAPSGTAASNRQAPTPVSAGVSSLRTPVSAGGLSAGSSTANKMERTTAKSRKGGKGKPRGLKLGGDGVGSGAEGSLSTTTWSGASSERSGSTASIPHSGVSEKGVERSQAQAITRLASLCESEVLPTIA